eukprot:Pgem_evm2s18280
MDIQNLEKDYLEFITNNSTKYGKPLFYGMPGQTEEEQKIRAHFKKHDHFLGTCAPGGCGCPINILCWTIFLPFAVYNCAMKFKRAKEKSAKKALQLRSQRFVVFSTSVVKLGKTFDGTIEELKQLHFADHNEIKQEFTNHVLDINNDGINGCFQNMMVPSISGVLVFTGETRRIFKGGDRSDPSNWEIRPVPETSMLMPE